MGKLLGEVRLAVDGVNDGVGEDFLGDLLCGLGIDAMHVVAATSANFDINTEHGMNGLLYGLGIRVHDAGQGMHFDECGCAGGSGADGCDFRDGICKKLIGELADLGWREIAFEQVEAGGVDGFGR